MKKLCIDFGSGYNPRKNFKTCDITTNPRLDYQYDGEETIIGLKENSVDIFYLRNVVRHIQNLHKTFNVLRRYLKPKGKLVIIDCNKKSFKANVILDKVWYRYVGNDRNIYLSENYRDYITVLINLGFNQKYYKQFKEKEISTYERD